MRTFLAFLKDAFFLDKVNIGENAMRAAIMFTAEGRYALVGRTGTIQTYARHRDARRGADRRGLRLV